MVELCTTLPRSQDGSTSDAGESGLPSVLGRLRWPGINILKLLAVGVWLLRDIIDIAEPGRGPGLGLGGASESVLPSESEKRSAAPESEPESARLSVPRPDSDVVVVGSMRYDTPPLSAPTTMTERSKRSSLSAVDERLPDAGQGVRGLRPLSSTFFRADCPTQFTSCFIASRSDTARRCAVRRTVLARGRVWKGVMPVGRMGVMKGKRCGVAWTEAILDTRGVNC